MKIYERNGKLLAWSGKSHNEKTAQNVPTTLGKILLQIKETMSFSCV